MDKISEQKIKVSNVLRPTTETSSTQRTERQRRRLRQGQKPLCQRIIRQIEEVFTHNSQSILTAEEKKERIGGWVVCCGATLEHS